jgi:hypothetical protein
MHLVANVITVCMLVGLTAMSVPAPMPGQTPKPSAQEKRKEWQPATFKGLTVGTATRADVLKTFGTPLRQDISEGDDDISEVWYIYKDVGDFPGQFTVAIDTRTDRVAAMTLVFQEEVKQETVLSRLGKDYEIVHYDECPGFDDSESGPVYESNKGNGVFIEYRSRGIAVMPAGDGTVYDIRYLARAPGLSSLEECRTELAKRRDQKHKLKKRG